MEHCDLCRTRQFQSPEGEIYLTPLLVPSFSSVVSRTEFQIKLEIIQKSARDLLPNWSLISAFDLKNSDLLEDDIWASKLLFIDSGNYESRDFRLNGGNKWSRGDHEGIIQKLDPLSDVVLVNYDEYLPIENQIENATEFFKQNSWAISDFLVKPEKLDEKYINAERITAFSKQMNQFDIIGFTEKELGKSQFDKCRSLIQIRNAMGNIPIHIFGCLEPLIALIYSLCGADIFDGTSWLRFAFWENLPIYMKNYSLMSEDWERSDSSVLAATVLQNLTFLSKFETKLRGFSQHYDISELGLQTDFERKIKSLIKKLGIQIGGN